MYLLQISFNFLLFILGSLGIVFNRKTILNTIMSIELVLLSLNLNFIVYSNYLDDMYGQVVCMFILCIAACESSIGIALIILHFRIRNNISINQKYTIRN